MSVGTPKTPLLYDHANETSNYPSHIQVWHIVKAFTQLSDLSSMILVGWALAYHAPINSVGVQKYVQNQLVIDKFWKGFWYRFKPLVKTLGRLASSLVHKSQRNLDMSWHTPKFINPSGSLRQLRVFRTGWLMFVSLAIHALATHRTTLARRPWMVICIICSGWHLFRLSFQSGTASVTLRHWYVSFRSSSFYLLTYSNGTPPTILDFLGLMNRLFDHSCSINFSLSVFLPYSIQCRISSYCPLS